MTKKKSANLRKFINDIHLWLGLFSGIILFIICATGTILTYEKEIKALFAQDPQVKAIGKKHSLDELVVILKAHTKGLVSRVSIEEHPEAPYAFVVKKDPKEKRGSTYFMDPYTGEILHNKQNPADGFMLTIFKMHRWLLLDIPYGRPIVGIATIIFIILSISGLILWFPKRLRWKNLKTGFKIKTSANWKRINHDLHNTLGFYACAFLLIMGITGLCWSFEGYREGLGKLLGTPIFGRNNSKLQHHHPKKEAPAIKYEDALILLNEKLPYHGKVTMYFPTEKTPYYTLSKYDETSWMPSASDTYLIDRYGNTLQEDLFSNKPFNVKLASLIKPLHTGEIFGGFSKFIYFLACLIGTSLPITGTLIWFNKLKKKKGSKRC